MRAVIGSDLASARDLVSGTVALMPTHGRNANVMVLRSDGDSLFVKEPREGESREFVANEWRALTILGAEDHPARDVVPRLVDPGSDPSRTGRLVVEAVQRSETLAALLAHPDVVAGPALAATGRALAFVHGGRIGAESASRDADQSAGRLLVPTLGELRHLSAANVELIQMAQEDGALLEGLRALDETLEPVCLVHGDVRLQNVLVPDDGDRDRIWLVDWEFAGLGDPRADVGALIGELMALWVRSMPDVPGASMAELDPFASFSREQLGECASSALRAYSEAACLSASGRFPWLESCLGHAASALIRSALSVGDGQSSVSGHQILLASIAERLLADPLASGGPLVAIDRIWRGAA